MTISSIVNVCNPVNWFSSAITSKNNSNVQNVALRSATGIAGAYIFLDGVMAAREINVPTRQNMQVAPIVKATTELAIGVITMFAAIR